MSTSPDFVSALTTRSSTSPPSSCLSLLFVSEGAFELAAVADRSGAKDGPRSAQEVEQIRFFQSENTSGEQRFGMFHVNLSNQRCASGAETLFLDYLLFAAIVFVFRVVVEQGPSARF